MRTINWLQSFCENCKKNLRGSGKCEPNPKKFGTKPTQIRKWKKEKEKKREIKD